MPEWFRKKHAVWSLLAVVLTVLLVVSLNYLRKEIGREGRQLKIKRTLELRIVPLLKSKYFGFNQRDNLVYNQNYLYASFTYPYDSNIDVKLNQLTHHIQRYGMEGDFSNDFEQQRIVYRIRKDGRQIALFHMIRGQKPSTGEMILILDDFGYNLNETTADFLAMKVPLNISVIPGHQFSRQIADMAVRAGQEVMIHMPMEPFDYSGGEEDYILKTSMSNYEIGRRLQMAFEELPMARAMNNHMGSKATSDPDLMRSLARMLSQKRMIFVDSYTYGGSKAGDILPSYGVFTLKRDVFLDNESDLGYIQGQIRQALRIAERTGMVVAIGHDRPGTYRALKEMLPEIRRRGISLIRISKYFNDRVPA